MARLSKTQQERNARIKALMRDAPEGTDIHKLMWEFLPGPMRGGLVPATAHAGTDRHAAIAAAAAVEHALKQAISTHLLPNADLKAVFDNYPGSPLGSFDARITMAASLGILLAVYEEDLHVIRRIRNLFAHSMLPITFEQDDVKELVDELRFLADNDFQDILNEYNSSRDKYVLSCAAYHGIISAHKPHWHSSYLANALRSWQSIQKEQHPLDAPPEGHNPEKP